MNIKPQSDRGQHGRADASVLERDVPDTGRFEIPAALQALCVGDDVKGLTPWLAGRSELFAPSEVVRYDPRHTAHAVFFEALRTLDHEGWNAPLGRERPSWVFYDCVLVPGVAFGFARDGVPVSMLAVIPTIDGCDLVQCLAARAQPDLDEESLAASTLRTGLAQLAIQRLQVVLPWGARFFSRFTTLGALRLQTAWTPAHDETATATFTVGGVATRSLPNYFDLKAMQAQLEAGVAITVAPTGAATIDPNGGRS